MEKTGIELAEGVAKEAAKEIEKNKSDFRFILERQGKTSDHIFVALIAVVIAWVFSVVLIVAGFLLYLNQYDYTSTTEAIGIYTAVDNSGNVIANDVTTEEWKLFMEWLNGQGQSNKGAN